MRCFRNLHAGILLRNSLISTLNAFLCFLFFAIVRTCTYPVYLEANHDFAAGASFHVRKPALPDFCEVEQTLDSSDCNRKVGWDVCNSFFQDQYVVT